MKGGQQAVRALCAVSFLVLCGCAIGGGADSPNTTYKTPSTERDLLVEAAEDVKRSEWPAPESAPMLSWITGGDRDRVTKSDAIAFYIHSLPAAGRFQALLADADAKLMDAERFHQTAILAITAPRVSAQDIALVETCIRTLREQRDIYAAAAGALDDAGELVDDGEVDQMRRRFGDVVRALGDAADLLAERSQRDRTSTLASPDRILAGAAPEL